MKLEKAIETLSKLKWVGANGEDTKEQLATQLGIEALKRIEEWREGKVLNPDFMLLGETE